MNTPQGVSRVGFVYSDIYLQHDTPAGHPERKERLTAIVNRLEESHLLSKLERIEAACGSREVVDDRAYAGTCPVDPQAV